MTPLRERRGWALARVLGDAVIAVSALGLAFWLRIYLPLPFTQGLLPPDRISFLVREGLAAVVAQWVALYFLGFYDADRPLTAAELSRRLLPATLAQSALLAGYLFFANRTFPRSVLLVYALLDLVLLVLWRRWANRSGPRTHRRVVLVGEGADALEAVKAAAETAQAKHMQVLAGHGLTYRNARAIADIPQIVEVNIGHNIIARAALVGLDRAVRDMLDVLK